MNKAIIVQIDLKIVLDHWKNLYVECSAERSFFMLEAIEYIPCVSISQYRRSGVWYNISCYYVVAIYTLL